MEEEKILVFDSSILLRMYRHSYEDLEKLLKDLVEEEKKIWIPHQTYIEFKENKESQKLNTVAIAQYNKAINDLENIIKESQEKIMTQMKVYKGRKFPKIKSFEDEIISQYTTFKPLIKKYKDIYKKHTEESKKLHKTDPINSLVDRLQSNDQVGKRYSISKLLAIYEEAEKRYTYKLPPGYMDDLRYNKNNGKKGVEKYGDYLIWKQMIEKASEENKNILFVTEDQKEDWLEEGELREDLVEEFKELTDGKTIKRLSFKELIEDELNIKLKPFLKLELFPENYINSKEIEDAVECFIDEDTPDISFCLDSISEYEGLDIEHIEVKNIKNIKLDLDAIAIEDLDRDKNQMIYQLELRGNISYIINNFYEIEVNAIFFITSSFKINQIDGDNYELISIDLEIYSEEIEDYRIISSKNICQMCRINEGEFEHESGDSICKSCSNSLMLCTQCGTFFDQSTNKQLELCDGCFDEKIYSN